MSVAKPSSNFMKVCPTWAKKLISKNTKKSTIYSGMINFDTCLVAEPYGFRMNYLGFTCGPKHTNLCHDLSKSAGDIVEKYVDLQVIKNKLIALGNKFAEHYMKVHTK